MYYSMLTISQGSYGPNTAENPFYEKTCNVPHQLSIPGEC